MKYRCIDANAAIGLVYGRVYEMETRAGHPECLYIVDGQGRASDGWLACRFEPVARGRGGWARKALASAILGAIALASLGAIGFALWSKWRTDPSGLVAIGVVTGGTAGIWAVYFAVRWAIAELRPSGEATT